MEATQLTIKEAWAAKSTSSVSPTNRSRVISGSRLASAMNDLIAPVNSRIKLRFSSGLAYARMVSPVSCDTTESTSDSTCSKFSSATLRTALKLGKLVSFLMLSAFVVPTRPPSVAPQLRSRPQKLIRRRVADCTASLNSAPRHGVLQYRGSRCACWPKASAMRNCCRDWAEYMFSCCTRGSRTPASALFSPRSASMYARDASREAVSGSAKESIRKVTRSAVSELMMP
mmetsp:Transcript_52426/g.159344  ORF Transcript_52426/g.159344 Transcript_52426/m.159344 type:complete len:229 (-) Transcript_52426:203-889(-)